MDYKKIVNELKDFFRETQVCNNLITVCGHDFSGKSTVCQGLAKKTNATVYNLPGMHTQTEKEIRGVIKNPDLVMADATRYFLYVAADVEFFTNVFDNSKPTILDRYWLSRIVYQHIIGDIPLSRCLDDMLYASNNLFPVFTLILSCNKETAEYRRNLRGGILDHFDKILDEQCDHYRKLAILLDENSKKINKAYNLNIKHLDTSNMTINEMINKSEEIIKNHK